jgi:perosamine synthetase
MPKFIPVTEPDLSGNETKYLNEAVASRWISSQGPFVERFEEEFARWCGKSHGIATANGTVALHLALVALGIGSGDEVIVPSLTFAATANAVIYTGASPVLVDVLWENWTIDPHAVRRAITRRTKAIIPVHLYGYPCGMEELEDIVRQNGLYLIEDAAQAHGARFRGQPVGSFGDIACFSFFGNKILTTGEGGMCVTEDAGLAKRMRRLRDHGMDRSNGYWHPEVGYNYRMTNLQAAVGLAQLERLDSMLARRREIALEYTQKLQNLPGVTLQSITPQVELVCWLYTFLTEDREGKSCRDEVRAALQKARIDTRPIFYPLHVMPPYQDGRRRPISERISERGISIPSSSCLSDQDVTQVVGSVATAVGSIWGISSDDTSSKRAIPV